MDLSGLQLDAAASPGGGGHKRWRDVAAPLAMALAVSGPAAIGWLHATLTPPIPVPASIAMERAEPLEQRYQTLLQHYHSEQVLAAQGRETGSDALRHVLLEAADMSQTPDDFIRLTQAVFVNNVWIPAVEGVLVIPRTTLAQAPSREFTGLPTTGWKTEYKDATNGIISDEDQSHHLAAFMSLGYYHGAAAGDLGSVAHKLQEGQLRNTGDIRLGILAADFGARLGNSTVLGPVTGNLPVRDHSLSDEVRKLCDQISNPTQTSPDIPETWGTPARP